MGDYEKTYAMIKPDAVRAGKAEEIKQLIELNGFTIVAQQKLQVRPSGRDSPLACVPTAARGGRRRGGRGGAGACGLGHM